MKIQLIKCKSYGINGFKFLRDKVYTTDDETGKYLISTGDFVEVNSSEQEDKISESKEDIKSTINAEVEKAPTTSVDLSTMTVKELDEYATSIGLKFSGSPNKEEKLKLIKSFLDRI